MRIQTWQSLLLAATSLSYGVSAVPCTDGKCSRQALEVRAAKPAIPIVPVPKPPVVPIIPKPVVPKPVEPRPVVPPKPVEPAPGFVCKRAPGATCSNIEPFQQPELEAYRVKGQNVEAELVTAQKAKNPTDVERAQVPDNYNYQRDQNQRGPIGSDEAKFLEESHVQYARAEVWYRSSIKNKEGQNPSLDNVILETFEDPKNKGMIINESRAKKNDKAPDAEKLRWSDMTMYNWRESCKVADNQKPDTIEWMVRAGINKGDSADETQKLIMAAIERTKGDPKNINVFRSDPQASGITSDELAAYQLLAGSDHVHRVIKMLADYPATMRNVRIQSLTVTTRDTASSDEEFNILIKFMKVDNP